MLNVRYCFEQAYQTVLSLAENRDKHPEFCIPMAVVPSTISNNVPGTDFTLGADTALNEITEVLRCFKNMLAIKLTFSNISK